jgi:CDP-4-dehydro-6-deoxyglucose reductase, E1
MDIDFARPVFADEEREAVNRVMAGHWLASGQENERFEKAFAEKIGVPYALCVNSGSSANLIALASLKLPKGSRVLTSGCGFPATVSPILHLGLEPILVDYDKSTFNIDLNQLEQEMPNADAVILAHTMGNPVDMRWVMSLADYFGVPVIEDCCEAIGAKLNGRSVGAWGEIGTFSFYPSHHITALGGGGMVTFKNESDYHSGKSLRDWGKSATWDSGGRNNTSYMGKVDGLSYFPHYIYSSVGWNMKLPEANAAFGLEQLKRLDWIVSERNKNHDLILEGIEGIRQVSVCGDPSWFGVLLTPVKGDGHKLGDELEKRGVRHRPFFAGNITRHPPFQKYRKHLPVANSLMANTIFVGCWAGMTEEQCRYVSNAIGECLDLCRK